MIDLRIRLNRASAHNSQYRQRSSHGMHCTTLITCRKKADNDTKATTNTPLFTQPINASLALSPLVTGKLFICTECGKCCTGKGEVWCNTEEVASIARLLNTDNKHFLDEYCKSYSRRPGWYLLKRKTGTGDCVFLKEDGKTCSIYQARPTQCSTYPFWPELMSDSAWNAEAESVCEGINHEDAPVVDVVEATEKLARASEYTADFDAAGMTRSAARRRK